MAKKTEGGVRFWLNWLVADGTLFYSSSRKQSPGDLSTLPTTPFSCDFLAILLKFVYACRRGLALGVDGVNFVSQIAELC